MLFGVLGPLECRTGGEALDAGPRKQRLVLVSLLAAPGRERTADELVDDIWGEHPPARPRASLHAYLSNLRAVLSPMAEARAGRVVIVRRRDRYALDVDADDVDADVFERHGRRCLDPMIGPAAIAEEARRALALWRGDPFADAVDEGFARASATRLRTLRREVAEARIVALVDLGRASRAAGEAEDLVAADPLDESARALLMLALYRSGRQVEALRAHAEGRAVLVDQLGVEPGRPLREMEQRILEHDPALLGPAASLLRDATAGSAVRGPAAPGAPTDLHPWRGAFAGRAAPLEVVRGALARDGGGPATTVLVRGDAGIGKTRLVEEALRDQPSRTRRVIWVQCDPESRRAGLWSVGTALRDALEPLDEVTRRRCIGPDGPALDPLLPRRAADHDAPRVTDRTDPVDPADRHRLFDAVARMLRRLAALAPLVLVVEDLHWANEVTAELVAFLALRRDRPGVALVATTRRAPTARSAPAVARVVASPDTTRIDLDGLGRDAVHELTSRVLRDPGRDLVDDILRRTRGNPLFVSELLRGLDDAVTDHRVAPGAPSSIVEIIVGRLGTLPTEALRLLTVGALAGPSFDLEVCAEVAGEAYPARVGALPRVRPAGESVAGDGRERVATSRAEVVDAAVTAGLVVEHPDIAGRFTFRHDLVREAIVAQASNLRRAAVHAALGRTLERRPVRGTDPVSDIAHHLCHGAAAGTALDGARAARSAVAASLRRYDADTARHFAELGIQALAHVDESERPAIEAELWCDLADALKWAFDLERSREAARRAYDLARSHGLLPVMVRATLAFNGNATTTTPWHGGWLRHEELAPLVGAAVAELAARDGSDELRGDQHVALFGTYAISQLDCGNPTRCERVTADLLERTRSTGALGDHLEALLYRFYYEDVVGSVEARRSLCEEVVRRAGRGASPTHEAMARRGLVALALERSDLGAARAELAAVWDLAASSSSEEIALQATFTTIAVDLLLGDLGGAGRALDEAESRFAHLGRARLDALAVQRMRLAYELDDLGPIERDVRARSEQSRTAGWTSTLAMVLAVTGRSDEARAQLATIPRRDYARVEARTQFHNVCSLGETAAELSVPDRASWSVSALSGHGHRLATFFVSLAFHGWVGLTLGRDLGVVGRFDEAERCLRDAEDRAVRLGSPLLAERARLALVELDLRRCVDPRLDPAAIANRADERGLPAVAAWARRLEHDPPCRAEPHPASSRER